MRHEVEVDTKLAELWQKAAEARARMEQSRLSLASRLGIRPYYVTRTRREVRETTEELLALAKQKIEAVGDMPWKVREIASAVEKYHGYEAALAAAREEAKPLEAEFNAKPWSRFFLVQNHGGHIHSTMACSTCRVTTQFGWLPDLSGLTEKDAVEAHGPLLCSVCFPSAPVEWTVGKPKAAK